VKAIVIGSIGQLGHDLMRVFDTQALGLTHEDCDVTHAASVTSVIDAVRPDWVINTAAFNRVDDCELDPTLAFAVNTIGAGNVARAAAEVRAGVVLFSTDYVFGRKMHERGYPYNENDAPGPQNVYGVSKWAGEQLVIQSNPRHMIIRSAGLYGIVTSRKGWTFPELVIQKARLGETLRVVNDQVTSPTYTYDLAKKVKELIENNVTGLFHLTNAGECSWFEFACTALEIARVHTAIEPIDTATSGRRARRPAYSAMTSIRLPQYGLSPLRLWQDALRDYLQIKIFE
jgi:dTDP-4-dehydrorhamnose reductase